MGTTVCSSHVSSVLGFLRRVVSYRDASRRGSRLPRSESKRAKIFDFKREYAVIACQRSLERVQNLLVGYTAAITPHTPESCTSATTAVDEKHMS